MVVCITVIDPIISQVMRDLDADIIAVSRMLTDSGKSHWYLVPTAGSAIVLWLVSRFRPEESKRQLQYLARVMTFIFIAVAFSGIMINLIKIVVGRSRPKLLDQEDIYGFFPFTLESDYHSFPSGHTNTLIALGCAISFFIPRWRMVMLSVLSLLAFTRVVINAHYLSDVIGGAVVAVVTTYWLRDILVRRGFDIRAPEPITKPDSS